MCMCVLCCSLQDRLEKKEEEKTQVHSDHEKKKDLMLREVSVSLMVP